MGNTDAERTQLTKTRYIGQSSKGVEVWDACIQITGENRLDTECLGLLAKIAFRLDGVPRTSRT